MKATTAHRLQGIAGLLGAWLFFAGDMLFNGHFGSGSGYLSETQSTVRAASLQRLFAGGLVGPPAACLCIVGFCHVGRNVRESARVAARAMLVLSFVFWVFVGATHLLWTPKALATKFCVSPQSDCFALEQAIRTCWAMASDLAAIPGYVLALLLMWLVLSGRTLYPRWTAIVNPGIWIGLASYLPNVPAPMGAVLVGGSYNLPWLLFFLVSIITTWQANGSEPNRASGFMR